MKAVHLDTDFLVKAAATAGQERQQLIQLLEQEVPVGMSAIAWYEFSRGPRTPEQLAVAAFLIEEDDVVAFDAAAAVQAADTFRRAGSPRPRANDIAIGTLAARAGAELWTLNPIDFADVPGLKIGPLARESG